MDPFSILVGTGSLIQMSLELGKYIKDVYEAAASFQEDVGSLLCEIQDLESVNKSIEHFHRNEVHGYSSGQLELPDQDLEIWQNTIKTLQNCSNTVKRLQSVLHGIIGKNGLKVTGWRDGVKKALRKQAKDGEVNEIRLKLSAYRESLNVSLTLLNLSEASFSKSWSTLTRNRICTQKGSRDAQNFGFQLHKQIASLQSRVLWNDSDTLHQSIRSASAVASTLHLNKHFDTPKAVSSIYTGRKTYLDGLKQAFDASNSSLENNSLHKRFVVFGLGGSGKTQFCCKFASVNKQRFWGVFTVDASSPGNAQQSFIAIAKACGTDPNERAAKSWLSSSDRPWLLLIDNADDANLEIEKYFPDGEHGLTLITTRSPSVKMHGTIGQGFYHFDRLEDDEATELLLRAADNHEPRTPTILKLASAITRTLGALPLALVHAGKAIKAKLCDLNNYIPYYERNWKMIRESRRMTGQDEDDAEYMKVYASYEIVFRGMEAMKWQKYRDAVQLLKIFSFLHYENIPFGFLTVAVRNPRIQREVDAQSSQQADKQAASSQSTPWWSREWPKTFWLMIEPILKKQFENQNPVILPTFLRDAELSTRSHFEDFDVRLRQALHVLTESSLITYYEYADSYSMHPLVHTWVRERPQMKIRDQAVWCEVALHTLSRCLLLPPLNETVDPHGDLARKLLPHVISVAKMQQKIEREFESNRDKRNRPWPPLETRMIPWRALFLAKSAVVFTECAHFAEAEACLRVVMNFNAKFLGPNHPRTERVALVVSDCLWQQCRVNEAADLQEQVLYRNLEALGPDHHRTLRVMDKLGESRRHQGRFAESIELLTKAMHGMESRLPNSDPAIYHVLEQLGITMRSCFRFEDARQYQEKAVAGMKRCLGETNAKTLTSVEELAITYKELGVTLLASDPRLARQYLEIAQAHAKFVLEQRKEQLGDRQPHTWIAQGTLARIKAAMGYVDEAEQIFSSLLPVAARHLGDDHLGVLSHKCHHAKILIQQSRYQEAETLLEEVSRPARYQVAASDGDHSDRWDTLWTLVDCYQKQGNTDRALATCNELISATKAIRQGRAQTEISSTFWQMMLDKRKELMGIALPDIVKTPASMTNGPRPVDGGPAELDSGSNAMSTGTQVVVTTRAEDFRLRGSTQTW